MVQRQDVLDYLKYLKTPLDIADPKAWKPEEIKVLKSYQKLAPELFKDLKADNCLSFSEVFPVQSPQAIDEMRGKDDRLVKSTWMTTNIANNLLKSGKIFGAEGQWFILLSLYQCECEQIKSFFLDSIKKVNKRLPPKKRERLKSFVTLGPMIRILKNYKKGKYVSLFSEVDVDLRNAVAHFAYEFSDDEIEYAGKKISTLGLVFKFRKVSALVAILFGNKLKAFAAEFEQLAKRMSWI